MTPSYPGSRYKEHRQQLASSPMENWLQYVNVSNKNGQRLLDNADNFDEQLEILKEISNEEFIVTVINNYRGESAYDYNFKRLITAVIETSGASVKNEELYAKQTAHTVTVHDGKTVRKETAQRKGMNYEQWTPAQKTFIKQRVKKGKSNEEIYKEYNYSKTFKKARTKESIDSQIQRYGSG